MIRKEKVILMNKIKKVTVHAGHNPSGRIAAGAVGLIDESKENRVICKKVIKLLKKNGIKAVNCTVNRGTSQSDVLYKICSKCNKEKNVDLNISIHFNSGAGDKKGNGHTTGTEVLVFDNKSDKADIAKRICNQMSKLGFKNRGIKINQGLYFLKHTNKPSLLIEVCFVDDKDDVKLYNSDKDAIAEAIVKAVLNHNKAC